MEISLFYSSLRHNVYQKWGVSSVFFTPKPQRLLEHEWDKRFMKLEEKLKAV